MEPRLRARRIEVARDEGRRRLRRVTVVAVVAGVALLTAAVAFSPLLDVDRMEVAGATNSGTEAVLAASGLREGAALITLDGAAAAARLERLPWVESATVSRSWSGTVSIEVVERVPVAVVGSGAAAMLVAGDGTVLGPAGRSSLPVVAGGPAAVGTTLGGERLVAASLVADLPASLRAQVERVRASEGPALSLVLTDGIVVRWGDAGRGTAKADALAVLLDRADRPTIDVIDVSVPRAATVSRRGGGA